jgi:hypothetical protein
MGSVYDREQSQKLKEISKQAKSSSCISKIALGIAIISLIVPILIAVYNK